MRFLSRCDKSATNIRECELWLSIGQVCLRIPPRDIPSPRYPQLPHAPIYTLFYPPIPAYTRPQLRSRPPLTPPTSKVPWATPPSPWYHTFIAFPQQALRAAISLEEYTLTDLSTYLSLPPEYRKKCRIYKKGSDEEDDPLLLPGHLLVGKKARDVLLAREFAEWCVGEMGQEVVRRFGRGMYSPAPVEGGRARL